MALGETDCGNRIGLGDSARLDYYSTLRRGNFLPKNRLPWREFHFAA